MKPPKYARIGHTEMELEEGSNSYYRIAGSWSIEFEEVDGRLITKNHPINPRLKGLPIIEITEEEWRKGNGGYL